MKNQVIDTINGYGRAGEYLENERIQQLARMTPEQARAIFNTLVTAWRPGNDTGLERLDAWRMETLIAVRHAFAQLARSKGYL